MQTLAHQRPRSGAMSDNQFIHATEPVGIKVRTEYSIIFKSYFLIYLKPLSLPPSGLF